MNKKKSNRIVSVVLLIIAIFIISLIVKEHFFDRSRIDNNPQFTIGTVEQKEFMGKTGYKMKFSYFVDGKKYIGNRFFKVGRCRRDLLDMYDEFYKKKFRVVYEAENPENSYMLLLPKQHNQFDIEPLPETVDLVNKLAPCDQWYTF